MKTRATITRRIRPGLYLVADQSGRTSLAESLDDWAPGAPVIVLDGQIIARAGTPPLVRRYEV